jgi:hypothetical protein
MYRTKPATSTALAEIAPVNKVKPRRQFLIGVSSSLSLPVISKSEKSKALFVSRFIPEVTADDVHKLLKEQLSLRKLVCTKLRTKFNSYSSFHISVTEDEFALIKNIGVWPSGCVIAPYYSKLTPDQIFTPSTPEAGAPAAATNSAANQANNDGVNGGSLTSTQTWIFSVMRAWVVRLRHMRISAIVSKFTIKTLEVSGSSNLNFMTTCAPPIST